MTDSEEEILANNTGSPAPHGALTFAGSASLWWRTRRALGKMSLKELVLKCSTNKLKKTMHAREKHATVTASSLILVTTAYSATSLEMAKTTTTSQ